MPLPPGSLPATLGQTGGPFLVGSHCEPGHLQASPLRMGVIAHASVFPDGDTATIVLMTIVSSEPSKGLNAQ